MFELKSISFLHGVAQNNFILWLIGGCSVLGISVFVERCFYLHRAEIKSNQFVLGIRSFIEQGSVVEAIRACEDTEGAVAHIVKAGLLRHDRNKEQIERAMEVRGLSEIAQLEKNAKVLSLIAHIAPLMGLLGTVLGFIDAFAQMRLTGLTDISTTQIGQAMEYALVTTAAGLVVAIPAIVGYNYVVSRIDGLVLEMQMTSSEIVDLLLSQKKRHEF